MKKNERLDDLLDNLRDTLESLPDDGQERQLRIKVGPNNSGNVAGGNQYILKVGPEEPDRPEASRTCPQCTRLTWRSTRNCVRCGLDLFEHDHAAWKRVVTRRYQRIAVCCGVPGIAMVFGAGLLPSPLAGWIGIVGAICLFFAMLAAKQGESLEKQ